MAVRLKGRGVSSTNFPKSLSAVSVANGMNQSHGVSRTHGVSSTNCRKLQERIVWTKGYLFYFFVEVTP
jgi:hypothetical protein